MCEWEVTKTTAAWVRLSRLSSLLVLLVLASSACLPVACHDARPHRAANSTATASASSSSGSVVGRHVRSYDYLTGDVHRRKLFSYQKFFLRIDKDGTVNGTKSGNDPFCK